MTILPLPVSLAAWGTPAFAAALKRELEALPPGSLPLQQGLAATSFALDEGIQVMVLAAGEAEGAIAARVGVFFSGIVAGCNCADDPTPVEPQGEYCELLLAIDLGTAAATVTLVAG
jgi:hypothetical protein